MPVDSHSVGDASTFLNLTTLQERLAALPPATVGSGRLTGIVRRVEGGVRETLERTALTRAHGVPGDAWGRGADPDPVAQITVMESPVAELIANGQSQELFGDQLFVTLDLSAEHLPTGSRVRIGSALLEVTPLPHNGCSKFMARFGNDALKLVSMKPLRHRNLRGVYMTVVEDGEVAVGDAVAVLAPA